MRRILTCMFLIILAALLIKAQDQASNLTPLSELSRRGQLTQLIQTANALLANPRLTPTEKGRVLTYLGHAYQRRGDFTKAAACYEQALAIFDRDARDPSEYATALGSLATLYAETGQMATAKHVLLRSMHIFEKDGDHHAEIAMIWNDLATIAADRRARSEAHKFMARALAEAQLAAHVSSDETAALITTQGRIAELDGDPRAAVSDYQRSLALWKQSHEEQHPETAWLYVLLGGAYLQAGDIANASETTTSGLHLLEASAGPQSPRFFAAELAYAKVLDASGATEEAAKLRKEAEAALHADSGRQSAQQEISTSALR